MNRPLSLALFVGGVVLVFYEIDSSSPVGWEVSRMSAGSPAGKTIFLLVCGAVAAVVGVAGVLGRSNPN